jgi:hypothetical protein
MSHGLLRDVVSRRRSARITMRAPAGENIFGFPLALTRMFLLLRETRDFWLDGLVIFPTHNIAAVRSGRYERVQERMLAAEGITARIAPPKGVALDSFESLFTSLQPNRMGFTLIEVARRYQNSASTYLVIGPITSVSKESVSIHGFSALGRWDRAPTRVAFNDICKIEWGCHYVKVFSKYLPPFPGGKGRSKK